MVLPCFRRGQSAIGRAELLWGPVRRLDSATLTQRHTETRPSSAELEPPPRNPSCPQAGNLKLRLVKEVSGEGKDRQPASGADYGHGGQAYEPPGKLVLFTRVVFDLANSLVEGERSQPGVSAISDNQYLSHDSMRPANFVPHRSWAGQIATQPYTKGHKSKQVNNSAQMPKNRHQESASAGRAASGCYARRNSRACVC